MEENIMFNTDDILARLRNGESAEDIASAMTSMLNDAEATYKKEQAQAKKAENAKALAARKRAAAEAIFAGVVHYFTAIDHPEVVKDYLNGKAYDEVVDEIVEGMDALFNTFHALDLFTKSLKDFEKPKVKVGTNANVAASKQNRSYEESINDFFRRFGL